MAVSSREQLKQYALRSLGAPVVEINVDDDQLEDRIEEALSYWHLYHYDGIEKVYLKCLIKPSKITINEANAASYSYNTTLTCKNASNVTVCQVTISSDPQTAGTNNELLVTFNNKDQVDLVNTITSITDGTTTSTVDTFEVGEMDKRYIEIPDYVYGVVRVLPFAGTNTSRSLFDIQYQLRLHDLYDLTSTSIIYYKVVMGHLAMLDMQLNGKPMFRFNRMNGRLYVDTNWEANIRVGDFLVVECYRALDPTVFTKVWNEPWLKHYVTALFKRQWATNMKKFSNILLPGGVRLNGAELYLEAMNEIVALENDLMNKASPLEFFMG